MGATIGQALRNLVRQEQLPDGDVRTRANRVEKVPAGELPKSNLVIGTNRNWRARVNLDGYVFSYNWSGNVNQVDSVPASATGQPFTSIMAISPEAVKDGDVMVIRNGYASAFDSGYAGTVRLANLLAEIRICENTGNQSLRMASPTPQLTGNLFSVGRQLCDFDENDSEPVFFGTDFIGMASGNGTGAVAIGTVQVPVVGAPLALQWNRVWSNATAGALNVTAQLTWDIDFYRRDTFQAGRRP